jgi:phage shock protein PspC (stress-responsive transcriptional regulator)
VSSLEHMRGRVSAQGLARPRRGRMLAGVCAGLGRRFGVPASVVRAAFAVSLLLPGPQALAYVVLWILMPKEP